MKGREMNQGWGERGVSRWCPTAEIRVRFRASTCRICDGQSGCVAGLSLTAIPSQPVSIIPLMIHTDLLRWNGFRQKDNRAHIWNLQSADIQYTGGHIRQQGSSTRTVKRISLGVKLGILLLLNLLKPSGFSKYHQVYHSKILHGARFALSVLCGYQNRQRLLLYTALTVWFL